MTITPLFVPKEGIEPSLPKEHDFESCASTSSATLAFLALMLTECPSTETS